MSRTRSPDDVLAWLRQEPSLAELASAFPEEWRTVQAELAGLATEAGDDPEAVHRYIATLAKPTGTTSTKQQRRAAVSLQVRRHMTAAALRQAQLSSVSGVSSGRVRFNLVNGYVAQKLLFARDLERKPVSLRWFRLVWPLLWQRRLLMPLVAPKGMYCFYSRPLIRELAGLAGGRRTLEVGAGDGALARFLTDAGVDLVATDDFSWSHNIEYPENVRQLTARDALRTYRPEVVICSWPPPGNPFERQIFKTPSVDVYITIGGQDEFAAGNWDDYRAQSEFTFEEVPALSRLVLPPEARSAVYVFRRKAR